MHIHTVISTEILQLCTTPRQIDLLPAIPSKEGIELEFQHS